MTVPRRFLRYERELARDFAGQIKERVGMKQYTTFKIGGMAELMLWPRDFSDLQKAVELARDRGLPWRVLGNGSNLLVKDGGVAEVLIRIEDAFSAPEAGDGQTRGAAGSGESSGSSAPGGEVTVRLKAGVKLSAAAKQCQVRGLAGLEWAAGIPASVGGAVIMNAGSLGSSLSDLVQWVEWYVPGSGLQRVERRELAYEYRRLSRPAGAVVLACGLKLKPDDPRAVHERIVKGLRWRRQTQPLSYPSAGSVFKNPPGDYAGRLIEAAGLKGQRIGDAQISDLHANFIVNRGRARSREVMRLIDRARAEVSKAAKVELELELEIIGEELP